MSNPKISIIVPVYNTAPYLHRCIDSILLQSFIDYELLLIDDGSTDESGTICDEYAAKDARIRVFHKENGGSSSARNMGLDNAKGDFIMHVDSDDWIEPDAIEVLVKKQKETGADIVSGNALAHYVDRDEELIEPDYSSVDEMVHQTIKLTLDHVIWRRLIRRSLYEDNHIRCVEGVNMGEDHHTLPKLVYYAKSIAKVDKVMYHYNCTNQGSYMRTHNTNQFNPIKYSNDRDSIDILINFFQDRNTDCVKELKEIKMEYAHRHLWMVLKNGNKSAFDELCRDMLSVKEYSYIVGWESNHVQFIASHYYLYWLLVRWKILMKKFTGTKNYQI